MMADCSLFDEDEVCIASSDRGIVYGLVVENSEYVSSDEYSDGDDVLGRVKRGTVRVSWHPDHKETVVAEKDLCLADRSLMPGDVVRRLIEGKDSQRGYVVDINSCSHVKAIGADKYIYEVNTKDLQPLQDIDHEPGDVTMDSWVGKIDTIYKNVTLRFPDDARCEIEDCHLNSFNDLLDKNRKNSEFATGDYFPGQVLRGKMYGLGLARWTSASNRYNAFVCSRKPNQSVSVCVEEVNISSVEVHWVCRGFSKVQNGQYVVGRFDPPPECITGKNLKRLQPLESHHCSIQLGDRCYYTIKDSDLIVSTQPSELPPLHVEDILQVKSTETAMLTKKGQKNTEKTKTERNSEDLPVEVCNGLYLKKNTKKPAEKNESVVVENGDLLKSKGHDPVEQPDETMDDADDESDELDSSSSNESNHSAGSQSTARRKHLKKKSAALTSTFKNKTRGKRPKKEIQLPVIACNVGDKVAVDVCYTFSSASVMWQDGSIEEEVPSVDLFPIHHLDELEFFPGDYVVGSKETGDTTEYGVIVTCDHAERTCFIKHMRAYGVGKATCPIEVKPASEVSVYDIKDHPYYKFRPGQVVIRVGGFEKSDVALEAAGLVKETSPEGFITVRWADQSISSSYPQELYIVNGEMSEGSSDSEWETESEVGGSLTDESWVTDEEEVIEDLDAEDLKNLATIEDKEKKNRKLSLSIEKLRELGDLLEMSHKALDKSGQLIVDYCQTEGSKLSGIVSIYMDILNIRKQFGKLWKSSYFEDPTLKTLISDLKREIRKGKSVVAVCHLTKVYASWKGEQESDKNEPVAMDTVGYTTYGDANLSACTDTVTSNANDIDHPQKSGGDNASCSQGECQGACNCQPVPNEVPASNQENSNVMFSKAWSLCQTIYSVLKENINLIEQEFQKVTEENNASMDVTKITNISVDETELKPVVSTDSQKDNFCEDRKNEKEQNLSHFRNNGTGMAVNENGDVTSQKDSRDTAILGHTTTTTKGSSDISKGDTSGVVLETVDNIIQKFVNNLPCLPESCLTPNSEESSILSRYEEVEDIQPNPENEAKSERKGFKILESVPSSHKFKSKTHTPVYLKSFMSAVRKELSLLQSSLPDGIFVKAFEDRMDLFSIMIIGPSKTPYEDGLFFFDVQLPNDYPKSPPVFHYISYCDDRLNPNLYEDGKVCVSLLGTWSGKGNEVWMNKSNMLQVLLSIQGLILVNEPYYNEAGFEKQRGSQHGHENSKMYNEMAALKLTQSMSGIANRPPEVFKMAAHRHISLTGQRLIRRLESWVERSNRHRQCQVNKPEAVSSTTTEGATNGPVQSQYDSFCVTNELQPCLQANEERSVKDDPTNVKSDAKINSPEKSSDRVGAPVVEDMETDLSEPEFPLLPASKGFCMTIIRHIEHFRKAYNIIKQS